MYCCRRFLLSARPDSLLTKKEGALESRFSLTDTPIGYGVTIHTIAGSIEFFFSSFHDQNKFCQAMRLADLKVDTTTTNRILSRC